MSARRSTGGDRLACRAARAGDKGAGHGASFVEPRDPEDPAIMHAFRRAVVVACLLAGTARAEDAGPLRTAVDGTFAPFAFPSLSGGVQGFSVDLFTEV